MNTRRQHGNAVLFSLIIMASAMTISLGMTSLVVGEVRSVSLVLPSEHAYYKAESYVEQALWQKKADPNYQFKPVTNSSGVVTPVVGQQLAADYLCNTPPCFLTAPTDQATLLKQFYATTSPTQTDVSFPADVTRQYDIVTTPANGSGDLIVSNIVGQGSSGPGDIGYQGMEVSIIAYPVSSNPASQFPVEAPTTPVFVDKIFIPDGEGSRTIPINTALRNPLGEAYPSLSSSNIYRLRIKALGGDAEADVSAVSGGQTLELRNPDFTVRAVAEDSNSRRGIEVLTPDAEQLSSIFDYVLFSDLDLNKTNAKVSPKSIVANVYRDNDGDCVRDANEPGFSNLLVTARANGVDQTQTTNDSGAASFIGLKTGTSYTVSTSVPAGSEICGPPGNDQSVAFTGTATEVKQVTFLMRPPAPSPTPSASPLPPRVPLYRSWNSGITDHFYTASLGEYQYWTTHGYNAEGITGYLYDVQVPGTQPLYRSWNGSATTHYYTMSKDSHDYWDANGYVDEGITGYLYPYTGTCPAGTGPLYEAWWPGGDHLYTMSAYEGSAGYLNPLGYLPQPIVGCMWTNDAGQLVPSPPTD